MMKTIRKEPGILILLGPLSVIGVIFLYLSVQCAVGLYYSVLPMHGSLAAALMVYATFITPICLIVVAKLWTQHIKESVRKEMKKHRKPY